MNCLKCKTDNQWGNFCSNCGAGLKEKCPECGRMERIGRKICETKIAEAIDLKKEFFNRRRNPRQEAIICLLLPVIVGLSTLIAEIFLSLKFPAFIRFLNHLPELGGILFFFVIPMASALIISYPFVSSVLHKEKQIEINFSNQHPAEAELLEKVKHSDLN